LKGDLELDEFLESVRSDVEISPEYLRHRSIRCFGSEDDRQIRRWRAYDCIYAELRHGGETFLLSGGIWYRVAKNFVDEIERAVSAIPETKVVLPRYRWEAEEDYNRRAKKESAGELALMDQKNILHGGGRSRIEFCDLYSRSRVMVHVKRDGGSSVLSHLFNQGLVSAEAFIQDAEFREKVNKKLPATHKIGATHRRPRPDRFEVAFAIAGKTRDRLALPFFSKVSLRHVARRLGAIGYRVTLTNIPPESASDADE